MFHMMIYMYKKSGDYDKARKLFALMNERGIQQNTVTYNSLMSFETNYKEVANIYDQVYYKLPYPFLCLDEVESTREGMQDSWMYMMVYYIWLNDGNYMHLKC